MDCMDRAELWADWERVYAHPREMAREWFGPGAGHVKATRDLGNYACNKAVAMACRERGEIQTAEIYESICERIYARLPIWARW